MTIWYLPSPDRWIRCEILSELLGHCRARLYTGQIISNLRRRKVGESIILESK